MRRALYQIFHSYRIIDYLRQSFNKQCKRTDSLGPLRLCKIIQALSAFDVSNIVWATALAAARTDRIEQVLQTSQRLSSSASGTQTMGELSR